MRWRILFPLPLIALLAVSCDQQPVAPESEATPLFDGAAVTNEVVYLHLGRVTWMDNDPDADEDWDVLLLGYDPAEDWDCNDGVAVGGVPFKEHHVVKEDAKSFGDRTVVVGTMIGRAPLYLYTRASFPPGGTPAEWCEFYKNDWLAAGTWHSHLTKDNDSTWWDETPGMNPWGIVENGVLKDRDGNSYKYSWKQNCLWEPGVIDECKTHIDRVERVGQH